MKLLAGDGEYRTQEQAIAYHNERKESMLGLLDIFKLWKENNTEAAQTLLDEAQSNFEEAESAATETQTAKDAAQATSEAAESALTEAQAAAEAAGCVCG